MPDRTVLTLGNFDGPHVGHRVIIQHARAITDEHAAQVVAVTFDPPPVEILNPAARPPAITTLEQRVLRLREAGADAVEVLRPDREMLAQSADTFIEKLVTQYRPVAIVEGPDFRFGKGREGDMDRLAELGKRLDFEAVTVPRVEVPLHDQQLVPVSSSLVRWLVGRGRVADAAACLGQPFSLTATVVKGEQRGRQLGIPTANLDPDQIAPYIVPADGVYAGLAELDGQPLIPAAISVGIKPTFGKKALTVEAHLLDQDLDLYGQTLTLHFARWVRDQYPFPGAEALLEQLHRDIDQTRRWHANGTLDSLDTAPKASA
ncbi:MAG: riboflavin biosynthesis protein RibF [Planctomycetota bacterium]